MALSEADEMPMEPEQELEAIGLCFAELRERPIKMLATCERSQGHRFGDELRAWIRLFEKYEMEVADPSGAELLAPPLAPTFRQLMEGKGPSAIADFVGFFSASQVVIQQDAMSYLASWHPSGSGRSKIYYFHPDDWGLWPTEGSLLARLYKLLQEQEQKLYDEDASIEAKVLLLERATRGEALAPEVDPARLFQRSQWLVQALMGVGRDLSKEMEKAPSIEEWEEERTVVDRYPHLAAYWLWAHHLIGNREELDDLLERTADVNNTVFAGAREIVVALEDELAVKPGAPPLETKEVVSRIAPISLFGAGARVRAKKRAEQGAVSPLEADLRALTDARSREIVRLVDHLSRGGTNRPEPTKDVPLDVDKAMERLAELVDARHRPWILERLSRAALFQDAHREASWGLILAAAQIAEGLPELESFLERTGTQNFGPRRMAELYRAYARFPDRRATEILTLGSRAWMNELEDWIRMTPNEPVLRLIERDTLEAHEVIAAILERASFSSANWDVAVVAACAAGDLRSARAKRGLERAVEMKLGRIEDGTRARVARAYFLAVGTDARAFLEAEVSKRIAAIRHADPKEVPLFERELACLFCGLLPAAPDDPLVHSKAEELSRTLAKAVDEQDRDQSGAVAGLSAILEGASLGEVRALTNTVAMIGRVLGASRSRRAKEVASRAIEVLKELG